MNKNELRKKYKELRLSNPDSDDIFKTIINLPEYISSSTIACFMSTPAEVDTHKLITYSLTHNKDIYLPRVIDKREMVFIRIDNLDNLVPNKFHVLEPVYDEDRVLTTNPDLTIVPGLCFDKKGYRIGYGGGFYDYFLSNHETTKLGICYDNQILEDELLEPDEYDIPMDLIVTEKRLIKSSRNLKI